MKRDQNFTGIAKVYKKNMSKYAEGKKRQLTMTFTTRFKDITIKKEDNNIIKLIVFLI